MRGKRIIIKQEKVTIKHAGKHKRQQKNKKEATERIKQVRFFWCYSSSLPGTALLIVILLLL